MGCEICGRGSCTKSFHSIEEQDNFDTVADQIKDRAKSWITDKVERLQYEEIDEEVYVRLSDVIDVIDDFY